MSPPSRAAVVRSVPALLWASWLLLSACDTRPPTSATAKEKPSAPLEAPSLTLMLLTDPRGYLEPCGCQQRPLGGVDKLAAVVAATRAEGPPVMLLAAGDLYFGAELHGEDVEGARTQELWKADALAGIWKDIGMVAAAPGPLDFSMGADTASSLHDTGGFPWLSETLQVERPALSEGRLFELGAHRVGVLASQVASPAAAWPEGVSTEEADLKVAVQQLRSQGAELVVGLHYGDRRSVRALARAGADLVVLGGLDEERPLPPSAQGDGHVLHAGRQGQYVVRVDVSLRGEGPLADASAWSVEAEHARIADEAASLAKKISAWEKDPKVAASDLATQKARLAELRGSLKPGAASRPRGRWFAAQLVPLDPGVEGDAQVAARVDAYDARVNEHNREALKDRVPPPAPPGEASYVGSASCGACHAPAARWWETTAHGNAYATLERVHKEFNLSCVGCHVTGYNEPGGSTVTHVEQLKNVGCESCHGPGSLHVEHPEETGLVQRDVAESVCAGCHTPDHSARFDYASFRPLMIAPGHGMPVAAAAGQTPEAP